MLSSSLRVAFTTLGCKVNQSETDLLARQFAAAGHRCVAFDQPADVYVVNTCTVTQVADKKSRQMLKHGRCLNPEALVVATGCYASIVGDALADDRTLVIRPRDKDRIVQLVTGRLRRSTPELPFCADPEKYLRVAGGQDRSRAMVKAQDGCDAHCTYCIIPRARGRSRSLAPDDVVRRTQALVDEGHAEVVITGVDLGSYSADGGQLDLGGLIERLLAETTVRRLRISSLEPGDFDPAWLDLWHSPRLCRHLHVPLQAGSAAVLERMERKYSPEGYAEMVLRCRLAIPGITITTDVMVGFPGETEEEFAEGYAFVTAQRFDGMHVFRYSRRSGTRATQLSHQVAEEIKAERSRLLREEASAGATRLVERHIGALATVAWENGRDDVARGMTDTNVRAYSPRPGAGVMSRVRLGSPYADGLWVEPVQVEIPLVSVS